MASTAKRGGGGNSSEKIKLIVAVVILLGGVVLILNATGMLDSLFGPKPTRTPEGETPELTPEDQQDWDQIQEDNNQFWGNNPPKPSGA